MRPIAAALCTMNFIQGHSFFSLRLSFERERQVRSFVLFLFVQRHHTDLTMDQSTTFAKLLRVLQFRKHIKGKIIR